MQVWPKRCNWWCGLRNLLHNGPRRSDSSGWKILPLTAACLPCITSHSTAEVVSLESGYWRLSLSGYCHGNTAIRFTALDEGHDHPDKVDGGYDRKVDISGGQYFPRAIYIDEQTSFWIEAKKTGAGSEAMLNVTLLTERLYIYRLIITQITSNSHKCTENFSSFLTEIV